MHKKKVTTSKLLINTYFVLVVIFGMAVSHGDTTLVTETTIRVFSVFRLMLTLICLGLFAHRRNINRDFYFLMPILFWLIVHLHAYTRQTWNIVTLIASVMFFFFKDEEKRIIFEKYKKFVVITSAIGIILYLFYIIKLPIPYRIVDWYGDNVNHSNYVDFRICYIFINKAGGVVRLCGLFNEPGYLGTFAAFFLCADDLDHKKKENWILFIAGVFTFSLAFYAIIVLYYALTCHKNPKKMVIIIFLFLFYVFILPRIQFKDQGMQFFVNRFKFQDGQFTGNNRTSTMYDLLFFRWLRSDKILFGYGAGYKRLMLINDLGNDSSYKTYLIDYGVIGFLIIYGTLFFAALKKRKTELGLFYIIVYFLSVYQRPIIYTVPCFVMLFGAIEYINRENRTGKGNSIKHGKNITLR